MFEQTLFKLYPCRTYLRDLLVGFYAKEKSGGDFSVRKADITFRFEQTLFKMLIQDFDYIGIVIICKIIAMLIIVGCQGFFRSDSR